MLVISILMHDFQGQCQVHRQQYVKLTDSKVRMASRFASSIQQEIEKLLEDKDSMILSLEMHLTFLLSIVL